MEDTLCAPDEPALKKVKDKESDQTSIAESSHVSSGKATHNYCAFRLRLCQRISRARAWYFTP